MRATDSVSLDELEVRMFSCFAAGALAAGCTHEVTEVSPRYDALTPDPWLTTVFRAEMERLGRTPLPMDLEVSVPLGSTDMGNVTQVMPGIHPVVGIEANGASIHQPEFTAAAAGPSADKAVTEGAVMLARTVVALAQAPDERARVLRKMADRAAVRQQVKAGRG
jgi:metal-dependent amidase/aminoacylase/carboxypeptidase family protein